MKIAVLSENTTNDKQFETQHGLSLYVETRKHKILVDMGNGDVFLKNAYKLNVDISAVDIAIITHGHSDHGGGLECFLNANRKAKVYIQETAFKPHFTKITKFLKVNIGLNEDLKTNPRIALLNGDFEINNEITLITNPKGKEFVPKFNASLMEKNEKRIAPDKFEHEQSVVIKEDKTLLIGGCAHTGILNIVKDAEEKLSKPVDFCISGFHLFNPATSATEDKEIIEKLAESLLKSHTVFYTCHCTGAKPYKTLKHHMKHKIEYLSCGKSLEI